MFSSGKILEFFFLLYNGPAALSAPAQLSSQVSLQQPPGEPLSHAHPHIGPPASGSHFSLGCFSFRGSLAFHWPPETERLWSEYCENLHT